MSGFSSSLLDTSVSWTDLFWAREVDAVVSDGAMASDWGMENTVQEVIV